MIYYIRSQTEQLLWRSIASRPQRTQHWASNVSTKLISTFKPTKKLDIKPPKNFISVVFTNLTLLWSLQMIIEYFWPN